MTPRNQQPVAGELRRVVVKIGSSSVTGADGTVDAGVVNSLCDEIVALREMGWQVVLVTSGAISTGWAAMGRGPRPSTSPPFRRSRRSASTSSCASTTMLSEQGVSSWVRC